MHLCLKNPILNHLLKETKGVQITPDFIINNAYEDSKNAKIIKKFQQELDVITLLLKEMSEPLFYVDLERTYLGSIYISFEDDDDDENRIFAARQHLERSRARLRKECFMTSSIQLQP